MVTVVAGTDDGTGGQVYFYVGTKTDSSNPVEAAGLTNGNLFSIKVSGLDVETNSTLLSGAVPFSAYNFGNVSSWTGGQLEAASKDATGANRVTSFQRPEDGAWDPNNPHDFYFVTTASFTGNSRLWKVHFSDPGNQPYVARIWRYDIATDQLVEVARHDLDRFTAGASGFLTQDEESSGVIDVSSILGQGWYLLVQQAHYPTDTELVEGGQLLALHIPPGKK